MAKPNEIRESANDNPPPPSYSPSQEIANRFPLDQLLRDYGFRIKRRLKNKPTLWEKNRTVFTQREALATIPYDEVLEAREADADYREEQKWKLAG